jgi:hypothetical protein
LRKGPEIGARHFALRSLAYINELCGGTRAHALKTIATRAIPNATASISSVHEMLPAPLVWAQFAIVTKPLQFLSINCLFGKKWINAPEFGKFCAHCLFALFCD